MPLLHFDFEFLNANTLILQNASMFVICMKFKKESNKALPISEYFVFGWIHPWGLVPRGKGILKYPY